MGDNEAVVQCSQGSMLGQFDEHGVVFHLAQGAEVRCLFLADGGYQPSQLQQFVVETIGSPVSCGFRQVGEVILQGVVSTVKEVLRVVLHHPEAVGLCRTGGHAQAPDDAPGKQMKDVHGPMG